MMIFYSTFRALGYGQLLEMSYKFKQEHHLKKRRLVTKEYVFSEEAILLGELTFLEKTTSLLARNWLAREYCCVEMI